MMKYVLGISRSWLVLAVVLTFTQLTFAEPKKEKRSWSDIGKSSSYHDYDRSPDWLSRWNGFGGVEETAYAAVERDSDGVIVSVQLWDLYEGAKTSKFKLEVSDRSADEQVKYKIRRLVLQDKDYFKDLDAYFGEYFKRIEYVRESNSKIYKPEKGTAIRKEPIFKYSSSINKYRYGVDTSDMPVVVEELYNKMKPTHQAALIVRHLVYKNAAVKFLSAYDHEYHTTAAVWTAQQVQAYVTHLFTDYGMGAYEKMAKHEYFALRSLMGNHYPYEKDGFQQAKDLATKEATQLCDDWKKKTEAEFKGKTLALILECAPRAQYQYQQNNSAYVALANGLLITVTKDVLFKMYEKVRGNFTGGDVKLEATLQAARASWSANCATWQENAKKLLGAKFFDADCGTRVDRRDDEFFRSRFYYTENYTVKEGQFFPKDVVKQRNVFPLLGSESQSDGVVVALIPDKEVTTNKGIGRGLSYDIGNDYSSAMQVQAISLAEKSLNEYFGKWVEESKKNPNFLYAVAERPTEPRSWVRFGKDDKPIGDEHYQLTAEWKAYFIEK